MRSKRAAISLVALAVVLLPPGVALPDEPTGEPAPGGRHSHELEVTDGSQRAGVRITGDTGASRSSAATVELWHEPSPGGGDQDEGAGQGPDSAPVPPELPGDRPLRTLPDLVPRPAYRVTISHPDGPLTGVDAMLEELGRGGGSAEGPVLRFTTTLDNIGAHGFELLAHPAQPDPGGEVPLTTDAFQCVRFEGPEIEGAQRACRQYQRVGTLTYHAHHRHLHIDGFARYELRRDVGGLPAYGTPEAVVATSEKVGWCVSDMERPIGPDGIPVPDEPWYRECSHFPTSPVPARMGISPGWGDTYHQHFPGQQIPLAGVADGIYWIAITVNPPDNAHGLHIQESDRVHNTSWTRVRIHGGGTAVEVLAEMHPAPGHYSAAPAYMIERRYPHS